MSRARMGRGAAPTTRRTGASAWAIWPDYLVETKRAIMLLTTRCWRSCGAPEDNGFVHQITNIDGENKIFAICNCNVNICNALRTSQLFNTPNMSRSAYVAKVKNRKLRCLRPLCGILPAGAVKLGQKLCTQKRPGGISPAGAARTP